MSFRKEQEDISEAKLRSHVPNDDLPDTAYLENAGKEKAGKMMNPNDSEGNPEAFMYMRGGQEGNNDCRRDHVPFAAGSSKSESAYKHRPSSSNRNDSIGHQRSARRQRNTRLESGSEIRTGSDHTVTHLNHHRRTSSCPKNGRYGGGSFSGSISGQSQLDGNYEYKHQRTTSVPQFGEWDETDPTSGEGFTVIFNKVKEEKLAPPASNFSTVAPEVKTMNYSDRHRSKCPTLSCGSKSKVI
ncbi:RPM1-interacting protein 4-like [Hibiscus syriacus]|uniref:RPM1-interacting protein 4-like n=1 Tax=Hibiscus syriacus TaxID=106335 RepID=UPI001924CF09|nr:RPM1-interacting protein 4-like [Hibiscus syriacus]